MTVAAKYCTAVRNFTHLMWTLRGGARVFADCALMITMSKLKYCKLFDIARKLN